jgi:hypothetical protein
MSVLELGPTSIILATGERVFAADFRDQTLPLVARHADNEYKATFPVSLLDADRPQMLRAPTELIVLGADCEVRDVILTIVAADQTTVVAGTKLTAGTPLVMPIYIPPGRPFAVRATGPVPFTLYLHTLIKRAANCWQTYD